MGFTKYYHLARINFITNLAYAEDVLMHAGFVAIIIFIFSQLWSTVYAGKAAIEGFTIVMIMWYFLMTECIVTTQGHVADDIGKEVKSGDLANHLNKPYHYLLQKFSTNIGFALFKFTSHFAIGSIIVLLTVGGIKINYLTLPLVAICVVLAVIMHFAIKAFIGIFAFWFEEARSLEFLYDKIIFIIGGMFFPLEFFPPWLAKISSWLPFSYSTYYPAKLFVAFDMHLFFQVVLFQLMWLTIIITVAFITFNILAKKVSINGG